MVAIAVPKPAKYFSVEMFGGAASALAGIEVVNRYVMPQIMPRIPLTGNALQVAGILSKALIGYLAFEAGRRLAGLPSDVVTGASFGIATSVIQDAVNLLTAMASRAIAGMPASPQIPAPAASPRPAGSEEIY